jgi:hypothetical protein
VGVRDRSNGCNTAKESTNCAGFTLKFEPSAADNPAMIVNVVGQSP